MALSNFWMCLVADHVTVVCVGLRELAIQIVEQFEALGSTIGLRCSVVSIIGLWLQTTMLFCAFEYPVSECCKLHVLHIDTLRCFVYLTAFLSNEVCFWFVWHNECSICCGQTQWTIAICRLSKYCFACSMLFLFIAAWANFDTKFLFFADHLISLSIIKDSLNILHVCTIILDASDVPCDIVSLMPIMLVCGYLWFQLTFYSFTSMLVEWIGCSKCYHLENILILLWVL